jgi:FAD:protein FMN transferase
MAMTRGEHERRIELFGSQVRILIGAPLIAGTRPAPVAALELEAFLREVHRRLTRFHPSSDLSKLNADPSECCHVSPLLALAIDAGLWAAEETGGLVDPTLTPELERAGYLRTRAGISAAPLGEALLAAPPRRPAGPRASAPWKQVRVDVERGIVRRPPGIRFDTGGSGKGLAADLCAQRLAGYSTFVVDAGGDLRIGGERPDRRLVEIEHPFRPQPAHVLAIVSGAVATSGIASRLWRGRAGFAHHLLDPSTGEPAWTGVIQATALGDTALEAETLAKAALLSGPEGGAALLARRGGLLVLDDGEVIKCGLLRGRQAPVAAHQQPPPRGASGHREELLAQRDLDALQQDRVGAAVARLPRREPDRGAR